MTTTETLFSFGPGRLGAKFSTDRTYRYELWRIWDDNLPAFRVIGLNPSTADESVDDPTIRRCIGFAKREGCGRLVMLNLFAIRATDPRAMLAHPSPIGELNDAMIRESVACGGVTVAAWGTHGSHLGRDKAVRALVPAMRCFGVTKGGHPRHPLYLAANTPLVPYAPDKPHDTSTRETNRTPPSQNSNDSGALHGDEAKR